jgi:DNA mismatch repair protein MutS
MTPLRQQYLRIKKQSSTLRVQHPTSNLDACPDIINLVSRAIVPQPPANLNSGGVIAPGYSSELDGIARASRNAKDWVANLERKERERTGIRSLVGYDFGA